MTIKKMYVLTIIMHGMNYQISTCMICLILKLIIESLFYQHYTHVSSLTETCVVMNS